MKIVIDTSVYVNYLRTKKGLYPYLIDLSQNTTLYTPSIVIMELWAGISMNNDESVQDVKRMLRPTKTISLNRQLAQKSGDLLRNKQVADSEDAIVAATAIYLKAQLATQNVKHFKSVPNLKIFKNETSK